MYDAIIVGGGHNGLVCAAYLAAGGLKTLVLERRAVVGGAAVTEEFHPGFRNSTASYTVSLLNPKVVADLDLYRHGLRIVDRPVQNFLPLPDGRSLTLGGHNTLKEIAKFSPRDAERFEAYQAHLAPIADFLRGLLLETPPNLGAANPLEMLGELLKTGRLASRARKLGKDGQRDLLDFMTASAGDVLDRWFESDPIKAVLGFDGIVGTYASPYTPGTAYVLLHHCFGDLRGQKGVWSHALGGMGAITQAMEKALAERGGELRLSTAVREILVENGRACGVVTETGETIRARAIVSNLNPKLLFSRLINPSDLIEDFRNRIENWRGGSGSFRMNVALSELPDFTSLPGRDPAPHHGAGIILAPSLGYMERAYHDARQFGWSKDPIVEMVIPSTLDDSLAPAGQHVASLFCQHVAPHLPDGRSWDDHRDDVADLMIETVNRYAPNFKSAVIARQIFSPLDLERTFGLADGDIFHGKLDLGQLFSARPMLGYADYRGPLKGLYMCGSGTHPGGGVTGVPGHNAAREILRDARAGKLKSA